MPDTNLADSIYRDLLRRVLTGEVRAGSRLEPERTLATRYGATRNTLREAIRKLEHARLVTVRQGSGVTVQDFRRTATPETIGPFLRHGLDVDEKARTLSDLLAARIGLLELSVRLAAERSTPTEITRLYAVREEQLRHYEARDVAGMLQAEVAFIDGLVDASHSLPARWMANTLLPVFQDVAGASPDLWVWDEELPRYLTSLLGALERGESEAAAAAVHRYYARVDARLHTMLGLRPEDRPQHLF